MSKTPIRCLIGLAALALPLISAAAAPSIKKCQDATGRWHYGDTAAGACASSKVTVINEQGLTKKVIAAPLSDEQMKQHQLHEQETRRAKEQAKERARQDELLLATYANEDDITYIRDRKLAQVEASIRASTDTLNPLRAALARLEGQAAAEQKAGAVSEQTAKALEQTRQQIGKHESTIAQKRQEQDQIRARAEQDLARYRAIRSQPVKATAPAAR